MNTANRFLLLAGLISLTACSKNPDGLSPDPGKLQAGFVKGHVVDTQGRPLAGATIIANSATHYNDTNMGISDANGNYKISLPNGPAVGAFYVRGSVKLKSDNNTYKLALFTEDDGTFMPDEGAVKNLRLELTGERTGNFGDDGYYGGTLEVGNYTRNSQFPNIEVTLVPVGPLVDGSVGDVQIAQPDWFYSYNIPLGTYKVTARDVTTNQPLKVKLKRDYKGGYQPSITTTFAPILADSDRYELAIEVGD